jgi:hypothetical protein
MNLYEGQSKVALRPKTTEQVSQARCICKCPYSTVQQVWASSKNIGCRPAALTGSRTFTCSVITGTLCGIVVAATIVPQP